VSAGLDAEAARRGFDELYQKAESSWNKLHDESASYVLLGAATCGISAGANEVNKAFVEAFSKHGLEVPVIKVGCMGHCYAEPMVVVKRPGWPGMVYHRLVPITANNLVRLFFTEDDPYLDVFLGATEENEMMLPTLSDLPRYGKEERKLLRNCGLIDPLDLGHAIATGAYGGLVRALEMGPEKTLASIRDSGLRGLGGAGFPTHRKWEVLAGSEDGERYLIMNGDEGDPGAFMDRTILESDPHAVIEGMLIAAVATGARRGYAYVRAEYPKAVETLRIAIAKAREAGLLGDDVLGSGLAFDLELVRGAGAFVCGEETALIESVEGRRGMPRVRPPYPVEHGLFNKPTAVNNVKTLAGAALVMREGPEAFAKVGNGASRGTAVFALAGKIANPGLVEVPLGTTLREVVFDIGGGIPGGKSFKAVQIGGPSGGCLPESLLDTRIDFDSLRDAGAIMGSGGMVVLDGDNCMVDAARYFLDFTQRESCGKCTFCRIGTRQMLEIMDRIVAGEGEERDPELLVELAEDVKAGSLCNLGRTAPNPVLTTLRYFRHEYEAHIRDKTCPAKVCKALTSYYIDPDKCARGCDACVGSCPPEAIYTTKRRVKAVDQSLCVKCDSCMNACPPEYDAVVKISPVEDTPEAPARDESGQLPND